MKERSNPYKFIIWIAILFASIARVYAESSDVGSALRSDYTRLRNIDPSGSLPVHAQAWVALATKMNDQFVRNRAGLSSSDLIFSADTNMRVWRANRSPGYARRAEAMLDVALTKGSDHDLLDNGWALILRGDVGRALNSSDARIFYERALKEGPYYKSVAQARLQSITNGTDGHFISSMDLETPRVFPWGNRSLRSPKKSIVLDPGHGGYDGGATGHGGLLEKDVTLDLAKQVKVFLESRYPVIVSLTREDDTFVPLARRTSFANKRKADAFVSIHLNASPSHNLHGLEAYYLDTADDEASRKLAERENGLPEGAALDDLSFILSDLIQSGKLEGSIELAHALEAGVVRAARPIYKGSRSYGVKKGPFFVLVGAHMPCSLLEVYFVDSPEDGARLASPQFRSAVAEGIGNALIQFLLPGSVIGYEVVSAPAKRVSPNKKKTKRKHRA
jgi:N-acetylmuramoyl-L-alanine amidase